MQQQTVQRTLKRHSFFRNPHLLPHSDPRAQSRPALCEPPRLGFEAYPKGLTRWNSRLTLSRFAPSARAKPKRSSNWASRWLRFSNIGWQIYVQPHPLRIFWLDTHKSAKTASIWLSLCVTDTASSSKLTTRTTP